MAQLTSGRGFEHPDLVKTILQAALSGMESRARQSPLDLPVTHRLAFRALGLSIGLRGLARTRHRMEDRPGRFSTSQWSLAGALLGHAPLGERIESSVSPARNRRAVTWTSHRDIDAVMLARSLVPKGFLTP